MNFKKLTTTVILCTVLALTSFAQSRMTVSVRVVDSDNYPLVGAGVIESGTKNGSVTDIDGFAQISVLPDARLEISSLGFQSKTIPVSGRTSVVVVLASESLALDDVVVVGYGVQKRETVTGAISQVAGDKIIKSPVSNISNAIVGRVSGIATVQQSGEVGFDETTIRVRGVGTYNGDQNPLVVIDGVVRDMASFNTLNSNDIMGINVLKDASATAVYGVRGANGVIIVTTRRGNEGRPKVSMSANFGFTTPTTLISFVDSYNYALLKNEALANDDKVGSKSFSQDELWKFQNNRDYTPDEVAAMTFLNEAQRNELLNSPAQFFSSHDYMSEIFASQLAPQQQYNVDVSGGTKDVSYYASVGYLNQRSLTNDFGFKDSAANSGSNRLNFRANFDFNMVKYTEIKVSISGQMKESSSITSASGSTSMGSRYKDLLLNIYEAPPFSAAGVIDGKLINGYANDGMMDSNKKAWGKSPIAYMLEKSKSRISQSTLNTSVNLVHHMDYLTEGLALRASVSYDHYISKTLLVSSDIPSYKFIRNPELPTELLFFGGDEKAKSYKEAGWSKHRKFYMEYGITYNHSFGKHDLSAMLLANGERYTANGLTYNIPQGFYGLVARATYSYDSRYFAEFNMGYNGSENFAPGKRFGTFPAVSLGYALSNEPFFVKNDILTWLKIRASYGQTGNSNIGGNRFLYLPGTWGNHGYSNPMEGYSFGSSNGTTLNPEYKGKYEISTGNPDVTWEKKNSYNLGIDTKFFKNQLSISADIFKEDRNNILTKLETVSSLVGMSSSVLPPVNVGRMTNKGFEIEASYDGSAGTDWYWHIGGNFSYSVNRIKYMAEPSYAYEWMNTTGFAYGQYKAYYNEGFYNTAEEVANHPHNDIDANKVQAGDLKIVDVNGDGIIDSKDIVPVGFSNIPRTTFGADLSLSWKGLSISLLFTGSAQGSFAMSDYLIVPFSQDQSSPLSYMTGRWTPERYAAGEAITYPRMSVNTATSQNNGKNAFWIRSTDHLKLKNIELSYNFASLKGFSKTHISGLRIFFNANNLYTWCFGDLIGGIDPELTNDSTSTRGLIYPLTRVYNFGFNMEF